MLGCSGQYYGWAKLFCGSLIETEDSDFVSGVDISLSSLIYPRTLVEETQVNGKVQLPITCTDPLDCSNKCDFFARRARDNGLPSPAACAMCVPPCPTNLIATAVDLVSAVRDDIISVIRLVTVCAQSVSACACQVLMLLKPSWIDNLQSPVEKCASASDVISLIMDRILVEAIRQAENIVNGLIKSINQVIGWFAKIPKVCFNFKTHKLCPEDPDVLETLLGCAPDDAEPHRRCFYERQKALCLRKQKHYEDYQQLFFSPTASELEQQFFDVLARRTSLPPSLMEAFKSVDTTDTRYNKAAQDICDSSIFDSMTLDQLVQAASSQFERFCPGGTDDNELETYINTVHFKLPEVVFDWSANPPPPPPARFIPHDWWRPTRRAWSRCARAARVAELDVRGLTNCDSRRPRSNRR